MNRESIMAYIDDKFDKIYVSFSGGKDSLGTLLFALEHFDKSKIEGVHVDLGYNNPETYPYLFYVFSKAEVKLNILKPTESFDDLAPLLGAPSHQKRWCTNQCKLLPMRDFFKTQKNVISFEGTRRSESVARALRPYLATPEDSYTGTTTFRPILMFSDYQLAKYCTQQGYLFNPLYNYLSRCGCYLCFEQGVKDWAMLRFFYPNLFRRTIEFLKLCSENIEWKKTYLKPLIEKMMSYNLKDGIPLRFFSKYSSILAIEKLVGINTNIIRDNPNYSFEDAMEQSKVSIDYSIVTQVGGN
jgi:3'-phosphoadenosine 5'-phosphosulfate sulfotransferase (PAPS reductase)/FAD synthetase